VFTAREIAYAGAGPARLERLAARFAAKEAAFKAAGVGWAKGVTWRDAEVVADPAGPPRLVARGALRRHARARGGTAFQLSLTHSGSYAAAVVLLVAS
jgi:holo-[acyl-carrier protein] synthase